MWLTVLNWARKVKVGTLAVVGVVIAGIALFLKFKSQSKQIEEQSNKIDDLNGQVATEKKNVKTVKEILEDKNKKDDQVQEVKAKAAADTAVINDKLAKETKALDAKEEVLDQAAGDADSAADAINQLRGV